MINPKIVFGILAIITKIIEDKFGLGGVGIFWTVLFGRPIIHFVSRPSIVNVFILGAIMY
jgi:hypothetical protein